MTYEALPEHRIVLRLEFSIADAVHQRGLVPVIITALRAWWTRPRMPQDIPAHLRADMGVPPVAGRAHWLDIPGGTHIPDPLRRPGM